MKTFKEFTENNNLDLGTDQILDEGFLRTVSRIVLINKVRTLGNDIKKEKKLEKKLDLLASQNFYLASLVFVKPSGEGPSKKKK